ncbi:prepilin-type N-terminal cleavage/methylation domain-containing protein [Noviherbaspirillum cavernae]|uniref:Prepilin-type N-terminal cleavage/methylation domain-containing protein n=1 Tax=Noviherbaspirillum cavernae TaxID=2320862 RepID=A0A418X2X6_9BURK|nr:prepilin-type N-terminal cleavage/methylation domain-containing protein [Noviherbaspirillum cavernae]RJG06828.1 prepilin-type N-terminal cleavage/methylation domain-containing protein [Noviherbaspirillum cavernae]
MKNHKIQRGFTLIELMITVVIVGILAAIVVPNYSDYVRRSALQEALSTMSDLRIRMEQFYQSNRNFGTDTCGHDGTAGRIDFSVPNARFTYACALTGTAPVSANEAYVITATGSTGGAVGHVFTIDHNNVKKTTRFKGGSVDKSCWLIKGSEC